jgi:glycosyltransferase involved in cell wall biosynthesis
MKVLFCDPLNTQNNFYIYAKYLRQYGVDAEVVMDSKVVPKDARPDWHDSETYDWLHYFDLPYFVPFKNPIKYLNQMDYLIDFAKEFDLIVCSGLAPMWMRWTGKPFVFFSYGSDLDQLPIYGWSGKTGQHFSITEKIVHFIIKYVHLNSIRRAKSSVIAPYQMATAKKLGLKNICYLPHIIDINVFKLSINREQQSHRLHEILNCDLILFHPPRQAWVDRSQADCKGNDKVFRAFAEFIQIYNGKAKLLVINKGWDVEASKALIKELDIEDKVVWLYPMPKADMVMLYNSVDIVLDQFVVGVLALVAIEAMACGTSAMTWITEATDGLYPERPPIINAHHESDIVRRLCALADSKEYRERRGEEGRKWVKENCSPVVSVPKHIEFLKSISID